MPVREKGDNMISRAAVMSIAASMVMHQPAMAQQSVKIAVLVGPSGANAIYGEGQLNAFNAAAELINARGGVLGRSWKTELIIGAQDLVPLLRFALQRPTPQ